MLSKPSLISVLNILIESCNNLHPVPEVCDMNSSCGPYPNFAFVILLIRFLFIRGHNSDRMKAVSNFKYSL